MTIFDSLRYNVSDPPTKAELGAIPREVFKKFLKKIGLEPMSDVTPTLASWYLTFVSFQPEETKEFQNYLIQLLCEYDDLR